MMYSNGNSFSESGHEPWIFAAVSAHLRVAGRG